MKKQAYIVICSACRENDVFLQAFLFYTISLGIHQVSDAEKALPHA
ncbi:hypothetical protein [Bacillus atrophaeus]|nr:hypothetical protein [Bacillus atrophaeus]MEC1730789.1 hypothetical protein [Bacillus atrophaeus]